MANINLNVVALGDFNQLRGQLDRLHAQVTSLNSALAATNTKLSNSELKKLTDHLDGAIKSTGLYTAQTVQLSSAAQHLGERIQKNNTTWRDFRYALKGVNDESTLYNKLGQRQVAMHKSLLTSMGDMVRVYTAHNVNMGDAGNKSAVFTEAIRAQNAVLTQGATKVINWGKNMQWAGRQLTAGLAMPVVLLSTQLAKMYNDVDKNLTNLAKVYGIGLEKPTEAMLAKVRTDVLGLAKDLAQTLGISANEVTDIAAQFAAAGLTGQELISATNQAARMVVLGETDKQEAIKATIALQTAYKLNTTDLTEAVNFFNAAQAATSTSMADLIEAVPKVGPVVRGLGGSYKDMVAIMTALKEGGVPAGEAANAIKNSMARLINPTKAASDRLKGFGIDISGIVSRNAGNLTGMIIELQKSLDTLSPLDRQKAIAELFGKFQYSRMAALMDNFNKTGTQSAKVMEMMGLSAAELSSIADDQTKKIQQSVSGRFKIAVETLKNDLLPIGEMALGKFTQLVEKINELANTMQNLPGPVKAVMKAFAIATIFAGPLIMITGLMGNFFGFILKGLIPIRALFTAITHGVNPLGVLGKKFELLSAEEIAARNSSKLFSDQAMKSASSVDIMTAAIEKQIQVLQQYEATLGGMGTQAVMGEATASATAGMGGTPYITKGGLTYTKPGSQTPQGSFERQLAVNTTRFEGARISGLSPADIGKYQQNLSDKLQLNMSDTSLSSFTTASGSLKKGTKLPPELQRLYDDAIIQSEKMGISMKQSVAAMDFLRPKIQDAVKIQQEVNAGAKLRLNKNTEMLNFDRQITNELKKTQVDQVKVEQLLQQRTAFIRQQIAQDEKLIAIQAEINAAQNPAELRAVYDKIIASSAEYAIEMVDAGNSISAINKNLHYSLKVVQDQITGISTSLSTDYMGVGSHNVAQADLSNPVTALLAKEIAAREANIASMEKSTAVTNAETSSTQKLTVAELEATAAVKADAAAHAADALAVGGGIPGEPGKGKGGLRGMLSKPGVKFGAGMALGVGGSMLAGMIPEGNAAKQPATMAATGAGFGMMFGPQGALIGAALGALAGGFMELKHQAEVAAAGLKSSLGVSKEELGALGLEIPKLASALPDFNNATTEAKTAVDNFKKAIEEASDTSAMKGFVDKLKEAGADQAKIDTLVKQKATAMALSGLKKEDVQIAIAGYLESAGLTRTNFDVGSLYGANGKAVSTVGTSAITGALSGIGLTPGQSALSTGPQGPYARGGGAASPAMAQLGIAAEALAAPFEALISTNTGLQEFLNTVRELDSQDFSNTTVGGQTLNKTLNSLVANNPQLKALNDKLKDKTPAERMFYLRAAVEGVGGSIANLPSMKTIDIQVLLNQKAVTQAASGVNADIAARAALKTSDAVESSGGGGGSGGESKKNKAIDAKIKANQELIDQIKEEQAERKKVIDLQNKENDFLKTKMGLQNQLKDALASGNLLQAAEVRQELSVLDAKKAQEDQQAKMDADAEARIKALEEANKKLEEKKSSGSGGGGGGGSSETAQQKAQEDLAKQIEDTTKKTLDQVNANTDLKETYGEFTSSEEVKDFNDYLKGLGATSEEIEKKNQELWASYAPTEEAMKGSEEFKTQMIATAKQFGLDLADPKQYGIAADVAARTIRDRLKQEQLSMDLTLNPQLSKDTVVMKIQNGKTKLMLQADKLMATGGFVSGPGTSTSDSIPARLSNGEFVMQASAVAKYGVPMLESMNQMKYSGGGYVVPSTPGMANGGSVSTGGTINAVFNISGADAQQVADQAIKKLELMMKRNGSTVRI